MSLKMTLSLANPLNVMGPIKIPEGPNNKGVVGMGQEGMTTGHSPGPEPGIEQPRSCRVTAIACTSRTCRCSGAAASRLSIAT